MVTQLVDRIRAEFLEMPGMRLTVPEAARLLSLDRMEVKSALDALVADRFLCETLDGAYCRVTDGSVRATRRAIASV